MVDPKFAISALSHVQTIGKSYEVFGKVMGSKHLWLCSVSLEIHTEGFAKSTFRSSRLSVLQDVSSVGKSQHVLVERI
jgi:hypothetical protein